MGIKFVLDVSLRWLRGLCKSHSFNNMLGEPLLYRSASSIYLEDTRGELSAMVDVDKWAALVRVVSLRWLR
jgi:hypothetical protein